MNWLPRSALVIPVEQYEFTRSRAVYQARSFCPTPLLSCTTATGEGPMTKPGDPKTTAVIEQICARFETEWRGGRRPTIETCLSEVPPVEQGPLFRELLKLEVECRLRCGERPPVEEYQKRF